MILELDPYSKLWRGDIVPLRDINQGAKYTRPAVLVLFKKGTIVAQYGMMPRGLFLAIPEPYRRYFEDSPEKIKPSKEQGKLF